MTVHDVARKLPDVPALRDLCRSMAMLEAVLNPDGEQCYSFSARWSETEAIASMRNGSGDEFDIVFSPAGAYIRAFDHESPMSPYHRDDVPVPWPGVVDSVPGLFRRYVEEPTFTDEEGTPVVTACLWRGAGDEHWQTGQIDFPKGHPDPDGSGWLFELLVDPTPDAFQKFTEYYYETTVDIDVVRHVYALRPLSRRQIAALNPQASLSDIARAANVIGYTVDDDLLLTPSD